MKLSLIVLGLIWAVTSFASAELPSVADNKLTAISGPSVAAKDVSDEWTATVCKDSLNGVGLSTLTTEHWEEYFALVRIRMLKSAEIAKLDAASLKKCLEVVYKKAVDEKEAVIPGSAIYCKRVEGGGVWVIPCVWEKCDPRIEGGRRLFPKLGHFMVYVFDADSLEILVFTSCG